MIPDISVIICTRNRLDDIKSSLEAFEKQTKPEYAEIIIVDNGSTDGTGEYLRRCQEDYRGPRLLTIFEERPGLSVARNRGLEDAVGAWVVFPDDDAVVPPTYIEQLTMGTHKYSGTYDLLGFTLKDILSGEWPEWMPPDFLDRSYPDEPGEIDLRKDWSRLNSQDIVVKRQLILDAGGFNPDLGMCGDRVHVGEESHLMRQLAENGSKAYWMGEPKVIHRLGATKGTRMHWWKRGIASGRFEALSLSKEIEAKGKIKVGLREIRVILMGISDLVIGLVSRRLTAVDQFILIKKLCKTWGRLSGALFDFNG